MEPWIQTILICSIFHGIAWVLGLWLLDQVQKKDPKQLEHHIFNGYRLVSLALSVPVYNYYVLYFLYKDYKRMLFKLKLRAMAPKLKEIANRIREGDPDNAEKLDLISDEVSKV